MFEEAFGRIEHFLAGKEMYNEQEQIKKDLDILFRRYEQLDEDLAEKQLGQFKALVAGIKPGLVPDGILSQAELDMVTAGLEDRFFARNNFIINCEALLKRVHDEPGLAEHVGWDSSKTLEENVDQASTFVSASPQANALTGFILGFPENAVRDMEKNLELKQRGIPEAADWLQIALYQELWDSFKVEEWEQEDQDVILKMGDEFFEEWERTEPWDEEAKWDEREKTINTMNDQYADDIVRMGERYFDVSKEDMERRANHRIADIMSPSGERAIYFSSCRGKDDPEIMALQQKVTVMFKELGL